MLYYLELLAHYLGAALELSASTHGIGAIALIGLVGVAGGAAALYARSVLALVSSFFGMPPTRRFTPPADVSEMLSQSDPDADGRPRPRAPGQPRTVAAR